MSPTPASPTPPTPQTVPRGELDQIVRGDHGHPHAILGPHLHGDVVTFRVLKPLA